MKIDLNRCLPQPIHNLEEMPDYWKSREAFHKKERKHTIMAAVVVSALIITATEILLILIL